MVDPALANARSLELELDWFARVLAHRLQSYFGQDAGETEPRLPAPPDLSAHDSRFSDFVRHYKLDEAERLILILCLIPHIRPQLLDPLLIQNEELGRPFTEFGGVRGSNLSGFLPTRETALFLIAGNDLAERLAAQALLGPGHFFTSHGVLDCQTADRAEPGNAGQLKLCQEFLDYFTIGRFVPPAFSESFPAKRIECRESWSDLVLKADVLERTQELRTWFRHGATLMQELGFANRMRPGYRCLFYGPPGTGKTMTAALLAKDCGREIYRVDLATVVSKWVGETSKNLAKVFDQAESRDWILFFDEADALFSKRTSTKDAHDKYANQEVAFLLQRIEDFDGVVILATNFRDQLDEAFTRRFDSIIHFPMPSRQERLCIWQSAIDGRIGLEDAVDLPELAEKYELSGGAILSVVRHAALMALDEDSRQLSPAGLERGIRLELQKSGRSMSV